MLFDKEQIVSSDPLRRRLRRLTKGERRDEAIKFIDLYFRENPTEDVSANARKKEVLRDLGRTGSYVHTPEELTFGARVAWRNHSRCIGRRFWKSLDVQDCRGIVAPDDVARRVFDHLVECQRGGSIRPMISIFAPALNGSSPVWIESRQATQYAGYGDKAGNVIGDMANIEATRSAISLGWKAPDQPGHFDLLPLCIRDSRGRRLLYELPQGQVIQVDICHPDYPGFAALGLKWYAAPIVTDMILTIGGIDYPCAPFNGFYMGTEIASRNLVDVNRYNLLPTVADALRFDVNDPLWKDRALVEMNCAVLFSFEKAGVSMVDHHTASEQYLDFIHAEHASGRLPSGSRDWIVPPQASSACQVFHVEMRDYNDVPNYYRTRAADGKSLTVSRETERLGEYGKRYFRVRHRLREWWRAQA